MDIKTLTRQFKTGATRDTDHDKIDYEGFLCPLVKQAYGLYMHEHRHMKDGSLRDSDNWQKGIPTSSAIQSLLRHVEDLHLEYRDYESRDGVKEALGGIMFNTMIIWRNLILSNIKLKRGRKLNWKK